jgi:hypothetical protein
MQKLVSAAMAAVPVTKSWFISWEHIEYVSYDGFLVFKQYGSLNPGEGWHMHVPPVSTKWSVLWRSSWGRRGPTGYN